MCMCVVTRTCLVGGGVGLHAEEDAATRLKGVHVSEKRSMGNIMCMFEYILCVKYFLLL